MRIFAAIVALCAAGLMILDARHWRTGDPRHASFRTVVVSVLILLGLSLAAQARPSPYLPVTQFNGDRYSAHTQMGPDVVRAVKAKQGAKARYLYPTRKRPPVSRKQMRDVPIPVPRPLAYEPYRVEAPATVGLLKNASYYRSRYHEQNINSPLSIGEGGRREAVRVIAHGRPAGCPVRSWCGCYLAKLYGMGSRALWLARNWAYVGSSLGGPIPGAIVVWRHHVGRITAVAGNRIRVLSGNDGRAVRDRWRSTAGVIAYRSPS